MTLTLSLKKKKYIYYTVRSFYGITIIFNSILRVFVTCAANKERIYTIISLNEMCI